jgi:hypothetical protein
MISENKTPWQIYLEKKHNREEELKNAKLSDLINKNKYSKDKKLIDKRISICEDCEYFIKITKQCTKCGCFMKLKTRLTDAHCPENKW